MRALLDTNIVIHRENIRATNYSIGLLFHWLDVLHYEKVIHPYTVSELRKYANDNIQSLYDAKLASYSIMKSIATQSESYKNLVNDVSPTDNDSIDNQLLFEVYCGKVDILITEDKRMHSKAAKLGIIDKVFTINAFITKATSENPSLIDYKSLSVRKDFFGNIDLTSSFFDSFRDSYPNFDKWFMKKCDEEVYICRNDQEIILGFLYLKTEEKDENYSDITPPFSPKRRLKVGTFKVESSGFRLGERFIKIIFDNALERNVDEIYITLFDNKPELKALCDLLIRWGFEKYGTKSTNGKEELVLLKRINIYNNNYTIKQNFPNIKYEHAKYFLPIEAKYHTRLLPDSQLRNENEVDFLGNQPQKYALQKVYISFSYKRDMHPGDFLVIYRNGVNPGRKCYESVISTIGIIDDIKYDFDNKEEFLKYCENRTVFSPEELNRFWIEKRDKLLVIKFIYVKSLTNKLNLLYLWDSGIVPIHSGPRPFDPIDDNHFDQILKTSSTKILLMR